MTHAPPQGRAAPNASATEREPRFATSADGTRIAYWTSGEGPPVVLVHGATADHTSWRRVVPLMAPRFELHAIDRRGRGASGDTEPYAFERELDDLEAVVEAVAAESNEGVDVIGHSFGGTIALAAAARGLRVRRLVLYEPATATELEAWPPGIVERIEADIAEGRREAALELMFRAVVGMPDHEFVEYRASPVWQVRVAAAHTLPRELRVEIHDTIVPADVAARVACPTLLLVGGDSPEPVVRGSRLTAAAVADARIAVLEGQQHVATLLAPEVFVEPVVAFLERG